MNYYFAYGSNLDEQQMKERCPDYAIVGKAILKDYKLDFTIFSPKRNCGCADIVPSKNDEVWGLVYLLSDSDLQKLDKAEAHPYKYKRFTIEVFDQQNQPLIAESYEVFNKEKEFQLPSKAYMNQIISGAAKFIFPDSYLKMLMDIKTID